jgi:uncharacterized protein (TIGR00297 family)
LDINTTQLLIGFLTAVLIALAAWRARSLSVSGAWAAAGLGTVIFGLGGWQWAVLLLGFFISSSGMSRLAKKRKVVFAEKFSKGSQRDAGQVLANGGVAGLCVLLHLLAPQGGWAWLAFAGSLAAANADTWGTELGVLGRSTPRLITSGKPVEKGESGGVTWEGTLAAFSGALLIALLAAAVEGGLGLALPFSALARMGLIALAGLLGSLLDSLLGATVQAIYTCPTCQKETERHPQHTCGALTTLKRGLPWMDNDWVNMLCTLCGAAVIGVLIFL